MSGRKFLQLHRPNARRRGNKIRAAWRKRGRKGRGYRLRYTSRFVFDEFKASGFAGITICRAFNAIREINFARGVMREGG